MTSPFIISPLAYGDAPQGGSLMPMILAPRDPSDTIDKQYAAGYFWLSSLDLKDAFGNSGSGSLFYQAGNQAGLPNWTFLSAGSSNLNTLSNGSTIVSPSGGGNIAILGTANEITSTASAPGHSITLSIPNNFVIPNNATVTNNLTVSGNLSVTGTLTITGVITFNSTVTINSTLTVTGLTTLAALTQVGTANINASGAAVTTIATGGTGALHLGNATGNTTLTGSFSTLTAAATFVVGTSAQTGKTTIVSSTAANDIVIQDGVNVGTQNVSISNGATAADSNVNILSGAGTAGVATLLMADNPRVTIIDLGNIAPAASRTTTVNGGTVIVAAVTDTLNLGTGGATTNANSVKTVNINTGGVTLGQVLTNIASGAVTSGTHTTSIASGNRAAGTMLVNLLTGTGTKSMAAGNADGLTTFGFKGPVNINVSQNSNTAINTGTSTGTIGIGNSLAGAITVATVAGVGIDAVTASHFTITGAADLTLSSTLGAVIASSAKTAATAIQLTASGVGGGITMSADTGGILPTTSGKFTVISTDNAAQSIELHANGGVTETIRLRADQGTSATSLDLLSDVGGITLNAGLASASAINITSSAAGGGWTLNSGTAGVTLANTGKLSLAGAAASDITITGAFDLTLASTAGRAILQSGKAATDAVKLNATDAAGGITMIAGTGNINMTGNVLKSTNPAFLSYLAVTATNKTGTGTAYTLGTDALTEVFDRGSNATTAGVFTAPVTGLYWLKSQITLTGCTIATTFVISIVATSRTAIYTFIKAAGSQDESVSVDSLFDMSATNTAHVTISVTGEAGDTVDIVGAASLQSYFTGYLVA